MDEEDLAAAAANSHCVAQDSDVFRLHTFKCVAEFLATDPKGDVMDATATAIDKPLDGAIRSGSFEKLEAAAVVQLEERDPDFFAGNFLDLRRRNAEQVFVLAARLRQIGDGDSDMVKVEASFRGQAGISSSRKETMSAVLVSGPKIPR